MTHPFPHLEPSLTPSGMPKLSVRKQCFQNKMFLFLKTHCSIFDKILLDNPPNNTLDNPPSELLDNSLKQSIGHPPT